MRSFRVHGVVAVQRTAQGGATRSNIEVDQMARYAVLMEAGGERNEPNPESKLNQNRPFQSNCDVHRHDLQCQLNVKTGQAKVLVLCGSPMDQSQADCRFIARQVAGINA
jgi:hypothetical protein